MVRAGSGGAGSGSLRIVGSLDDSSIMNGFRRIRQGFQSTKGEAGSFNADLQRMANTASSLAKKMTLLAVAGGTAMVGLASKSPAVAPALAKMGVQFERLQRTLGQALAPAFERVSVWFNKFVDFVDRNQDKISEMAGKILDFAEKVGKWLYPALEKIGNWAVKNPELFATIVAGLALAPAVLTGINALSGLASVLGGTVISASLLLALGKIALIGAAGYAGYKGAEYLVDKARNYVGSGQPHTAPNMDGRTLINRLPQQILSDMTGNPTAWADMNNTESPAFLMERARIVAQAKGEFGYFTGGNGAIHAVESDRRFSLMSWWESFRS